MTGAAWEVIARTRRTRTTEIKPILIFNSIFTNKINYVIHHVVMVTCRVVVVTLVTGRGGGKSQKNGEGCGEKWLFLLRIT